MHKANQFSLQNQIQGFISLEMEFYYYYYSDSDNFANQINAIVTREKHRLLMKKRHNSAEKNTQKKNKKIIEIKWFYGSMNSE